MASLRPEQLPAHLGKTLAPAYLLHGDEPLLALESADAIRAAARSKGYSERKVLAVDRYFKWAELAAAGSSMSLTAASSACRNRACASRSRVCAITAGVLQAMASNSAD